MLVQPALHYPSLDWRGLCCLAKPLCLHQKKVSSSAWGFFFSVVFQGRSQLHSCLAVMGIWDRAGYCRWARVDQESLGWRNLLKNEWHHFILLPPGRSKCCTVIKSHKSPRRCHRDKVLCSGYTCLSLLLLSLERAQRVCSLQGLFLKDLLQVFRRVAAWSHFHLPLPNCFSALQGAEGLSANLWVLFFGSEPIQHCRSGWVQEELAQSRFWKSTCYWNTRKNGFLLYCSLNFAAFCLISGLYLHSYTLSR